MYLLLLIFGAVLTAAGIILAGSGVSFSDHAFDASLVTPGVVATIGGLVLVGLGLALRILRRIEQALAAQPIPHADEPATAVASPAEPARPTAEPARFEVPPKAAAAILPRPVPKFAPAPATDRRVDDVPLPDKIVPERHAALASVEAARAAERADLSSKSFVPPTPLVASRADEEVAALNNVRTVRRANGSAPPRIVPRLDLAARSPGIAERPQGPAFESLWPKGPRPVRASDSAPLQPVAAPAASPVGEDAAAQAEAVVPVSILKSGVVDGMAYTLYSDGSIEAALPQGTLRFGSITELRNHIEQSA